MDISGARGPCLTMSNSAPLPTALRDFVNSTKWTFAKTMPEWPHEYIVRARVDENRFVQLVRHIRTHGYEGKFYRKSITYYDEGGMTYWTMGAPIDVTTVINRCETDDSYESRTHNGSIPKHNSQSNADKRV